MKIAAGLRSGSENWRRFTKFPHRFSDEWQRCGKVMSGNRGSGRNSPILEPCVDSFHVSASVHYEFTKDMQLHVPTPRALTSFIAAVLPVVNVPVLHGGWSCRTGGNG